MKHFNLKKAIKNFLTTLSNRHHRKWKAQKDNYRLFNESGYATFI